MSRKAKIASIALVSAMSMSLLAACGKGDSAAKSGADAASDPNAKHDPIELVFLQDNSGWTVDKFMENYGNKIKEKFPWITPKFIPTGEKDWYANAITSGEQIDIDFASVGHTHSSVLKYNLQYDISDLIKKYKMDLNRFEPTTIAIQRQVANGGIYGIPTANSSAALFYNKDIFDKFGVPYPKDNMTWDDTYELAKKLTRNEGGVKYRGFVMPFTISNINQMSLNFVDPKTNKALFDQDPRFVKLIDNFARFYKIPGNELASNETSVTRQGDFFKKDLTAAMYGFLTGVPSYPDELNWDVVSLPTFKDLPNIGVQSYPTYFYITSMSKNKDAAFEVLSYLTSDEFQLWQSKRGVQTSLKNSSTIQQTFGQETSAYKGKNVNKAYFTNKYAEPAVLTQYADLANNGLVAAFNDYILNKKDINTALRDAAEVTNKNIEAAGIK